jgi:hypothetical protein
MTALVVKILLHPIVVKGPEKSFPRYWMKPRISDCGNYVEASFQAVPGPGRLTYFFRFNPKSQLLLPCEKVVTTWRD